MTRYRKSETDRQTVSTIHLKEGSEDVPSIDSNSMKKRRLGFFFVSLLKTFHVHDAILTLCDDVTIVFSQINRKKDESETQKQALCLLLLDAV